MCKKVEGQSRVLHELEAKTDALPEMEVAKEMEALEARLIQVGQAASERVAHMSNLIHIWESLTAKSGALKKWVEDRSQATPPENPSSAQVKKQPCFEISWSFSVLLHYGICLHPSGTAEWGWDQRRGTQGVVSRDRSSGRVCQWWNCSWDAAGCQLA